MLLTTGNKRKKYIVHFSHLTTQFDEDNNEIESDGYIGTECRVLNMKKNCLVIGQSVLKAGDIFRKDIGRKKAFTAALRSGKFTRLQRKAMWKSYFAQCPLRRSK